MLAPEYDLLSPRRVLGVELGLRLAAVDVVLVTGRVVYSVQYLLKVEPRVGMWRAERNRHDREPLAQVIRPQPGLRPSFHAADEDAIVARRQVFHRHVQAAAQQVDFHEMHATGEQLAALGEILL